MVHVTNLLTQLHSELLSGSEHKAVTDDKDMHMFTRLRGIEKKLLLAVVGLGHIDGIELLWKCVEDADDDKFLQATSEKGDPPTG
ncbi:hypothetical protein C5167_009580 [Papaver somniferum]|uniref:Uncharacterized protein n=1 Tax=Papaver somniferum TaxID=3469 RepID=A0A4Y7K0Q4_PAPSO|nr:hypothetical protein C5167_009580 [Papaver somniferum]